MKEKKWALILGIVLLLAVGAGVLYSSRQRFRPEETLNIILIQKSMEEMDFWTFITQGARTAAHEYGVELLVEGPESEQNIDEQNQMILDAIAQKPDAIVLAPCSSEETTAYARQVVEAGITLILLDATLEEEIGVPLVATDNYALGYSMGEYVRDFVEEDSVIGIVGHSKYTSTCTDRDRGFRDGLGDAAEKIAEIVYCDSQVDIAVELATGLLETYPDMDILVGLNEHSSVGAVRAVEELGLTSDVLVVGVDSSSDEIKALESGVFEAIVVQKPFNMGYLGIETAVECLQGGKVEPLIDSGFKLITREDMYTEENQKLLFPVEDTV